MKEKKTLKFIFYAFLLLIAVGIIGYMLLLRISFIDALYMTVITVSTVGFGEVAKMDAPAEIFSIFMIFVGVGIVGYAFTTLVVMFVEGKVRSIVKGKRMDNRIAKLKDHYIICGSGEMANVIIHQFTEEQLNFLVVTTSADDVKAYNDENILAIEGCSTQEDCLEEAGIMRAKGLVSTFDTDVDNIVTVLTARNLNPEIYIISNSTDPACSKKLMKVGANKTLSAVEISGKRMAALMTKPHVISFLDVITQVGGVELDLEEVTVMPHSYLENKLLSEAKISQKTGLSVLAIKQNKDDELLFNPPADHRFSIGEVLIVLGREEQVEKLRGLGDPSN